MVEPTRGPHQKALEINLNPRQYGTIAEIGAGQETARWFFLAGGAAGTIAKAMSAYDMKVSDSIYGSAPRYVSRDRLHAMLDYEYQAVIDRLGEARGAESTFFAFANTVATRSYTYKNDGQGWLGVRFQTEPGAPFSQVEIHVHLLGKKNTEDQETLGVLGVNLIYAALNHHNEPEQLITSLIDDLSLNQVEIDMIDFAGEAFSNIDDRLMTMRLVQRGLTRAAMFNAEGEAVNIADALYKKSVLVERSRFRPPTNLTINLNEEAQKTFKRDIGCGDDELIVLSEMTLQNLLDGDDIDTGDFMNRVEILGALGKNVLISSYGAYHRLAAFLFRYTQKPIGVAMGIPTLKEIFNEKYYADLSGGILESFGRLFKNDLRLYVCPARDKDSGKLETISSFRLPSHLENLYCYLLDNGFIRQLDGVNEEFLSIYSHQVLEMIRNGTPGWEALVPDQVAAMIKDRALFGFGAQTSNTASTN